MRQITLENLSDKEKGYVVGLFLGDGNADYNQKDSRIMNAMKNICETLTITCKIKKVKNTPCGYIWRGRISTTFKYVPHNSRKVQRIYGCLS